MSRRKQDILEVIRQKSSMSQQVVAHKDSEYAFYSGGSYLIASKMAMIDALIKNGLIPKGMMLFIKLYRSILNQQRKAYFAATATEITKLGFLLGLKDDRITVSAPK